MSVADLVKKLDDSLIKMKEEMEELELSLFDMKRKIYKSDEIKSRSISPLMKNALIKKRTIIRKK